MKPINMIKKFISNEMSPQQIIMQAIQGNNSNPMLTNLIGMAEKGNKQDIENFARNLFKEKGRDFDKEFSEFMSQIKG